MRGRAAAIHDAKREEAYLLLWDRGETVLEPEVLPFADAVEKIRAFGPCALTGTGAPAARKLWARNFRSPIFASPMRCGWRGWPGPSDV